MSRPTEIKLGELLIRAGILTSEQLLESIELAKTTGMPIGRMLVMSGNVSENCLNASVQLQSMLRENQFDVETGVALLVMVAREDIPLEEALDKTGHKKEEKKPTVKLGELLVEGEFIGQEELQKYLSDSAEAGLPLGRIIMLYGTISKEALSACLTAQVLVRDGKVSREQAISALQAMRRRRIDLETSLRELGFYRKPIRPHTLIGELFIKAGITDEGNILGALETALELEIPVGQAMIQKNLVSRPDLEMALELQEMVINETLTEDQAAEVLKNVSQKGFALTMALTELAIASATEDDVKGMWQLLTFAGLVNKDSKEAIFQGSKITLAELGQRLLRAEMVDEFTLHNTCRCQFLMRSGFLAVDQAIVVINHCRTRRISTDMALKELNWIAKTRMELDSAV